MPLNKSTTHHQSVQFFVHFFFKKNCLFTEKKKNFKKILLSFTSNLLSFTAFYSVLPRLVLSLTKYPLRPPWRAPPGARGAASAFVEYVGTS